MLQDEYLELYTSTLDQIEPILPKLFHNIKDLDDVEWVPMLLSEILFFHRLYTFRNKYEQVYVRTYIFAEYCSCTARF